MKNIPSPETLRPLLEAALAIMAPNDPAREKLKVTLNIKAEMQSGCFAVYFYDYSSEPSRESFGSGPTPEEALQNFSSAYQPPITKADLIAKAEAELAKLRAS